MALAPALLKDTSISYTDSLLSILLFIAFDNKLYSPDTW